MVMIRNRLLCLLLLLLCSACGDDANWSLQQAIEQASADYPDQKSESFKQFAKQCSSCHRPPMPDMHSAQQWMSTVNRMLGHREKRGLPMMTDMQKQQVLAYLTSHARQDVQP